MASHLGLHCLSMWPFRGPQSRKGLVILVIIIVYIIRIFLGSDCLIITFLQAYTCILYQKALLSGLVY